MLGFWEKTRALLKVSCILRALRKNKSYWPIENAPHTEVLRKSVPVQRDKQSNTNTGLQERPIIRNIINKTQWKVYFLFFWVTVADYNRASKVKAKILAACLNLKLLEHERMNTKDHLPKSTSILFAEVFVKHLIWLHSCLRNQAP